MRIVDVNPFFRPYDGGIERRMYDFSKALAARGHEVTVLTGRLPGTAEEEMTDGFRVIRLRSRYINIYNPPYIRSEGVGDALTSLDADIVNYNYRWAPSYSKPLFRYEGKKTFTYHNMWGEGTGLAAKISMFNDNRFRKGLLTFDHIVCVSENMRQDLIRRGIDEKKLSTIPNTLNSLPELSDEEGDFILSLGRLVRIKGLEYLLEAMRSVDHKLIICGRGPDAKRIRKRIKRYGLGDRVEMKGWVTEEEKNRLMSTCKFFVMPSLSEAYGIAAAELLSRGRPMVCTNVNGLPETVGDAALMVSPKDPKGLANAMNTLLADASLRNDLRIKARAQAERFLLEHHIGAVESLYERIAFGSDGKENNNP